MLSKHPRFLPIYSGAVTAALLVTLLAAFDRPGSDTASFASIDVQRLRLVEPDGTVRLILASNARMPGLIFNGTEYPHEARKAYGTAGMWFFDAEGNESGGLSFGGRREADGKIVRFGRLSFDQYAQDEMLTLGTVQEGKEKHGGLTLKDQPDWPLEDLVKLIVAHKDDTPEVRQKAIDAFTASHPGKSHVQRVWLGSNDDHSSSLELKDDQGRPRLVAKVTADGTPMLVFLDEHGKTTHRLQAATAGTAPDQH